MQGEGTQFFSFSFISSIFCTMLLLITSDYTVLIRCKLSVIGGSRQVKLPNETHVDKMTLCIYFSLLLDENVFFT